tara:strand:- start:4849 stop:5274 length:426 start_codon:yes stop_codon:yes gene_type:complete
MAVIGALSSAKTTFTKDGKRKVKYTFTDSTDVTTAQFVTTPSFDLEGAETIYLQSTLTQASGNATTDVHLLVSLDGTNFTAAAAGNLIHDDAGVGTTVVGAVTVANYKGGVGRISAIGNAGTVDVGTVITVIFPHRVTVSR